MPPSASSDNGSISVPTLLQYLKSAEACGLVRQRMLREAGVSPELLLDNNGRLPIAALLRFLDYVLPNCGDPLFGLQTSQFVQPGSYGVIGYIAMASNNVGEALSRIAVYERVVGDMGATHVSMEPDVVVVRWDCYFEDAEIRRHVTENVLASWAVYTRWLADNQALAPGLPAPGCTTSPAGLSSTSRCSSSYMICSGISSPAAVVSTSSSAARRNSSPPKTRSLGLQAAPFMVRRPSLIQSFRRSRE